MLRDPDPKPVRLGSPFDQQLAGFFVVDVNAHALQDLQRCHVDLLALCRPHALIMGAGHARTVRFDHLLSLT